MSMKKNRLFNFVTLSLFSAAIFAFLLVLLYTGIIDEYYGSILILSCINIVVALSLNLITGFTGQLALGQAGFMAVGAYTTAVSVMQFNVPLFFALLLAGLVSSVFGLIIGFPTLRLRGDYLAITTLGFGEIIRVVMVNLNKLTGGAAGLKGIPPFLAGDDFILNMIVSFVWVFLFMLAVIIMVSNLIKSSPGRAIISIREDEIAANSMGINVQYYKMFAFVLSSFLAGIGGGLYATYLGYLNPMMFGFLNSVNFVVFAVFGGLGSITGTIIATTVLTFLQELLRDLGDLRLVFYGLLLIVMMIFWPRGLMGTNEFSPVGFVRKFLAGEYKLKNLRIPNMGKKTVNNKEVK